MRFVKSMNKIKLFFHNLLDLHKWEIIGVTKPIKNKDPFMQIVTHKALGKCRICGKEELRQVYGSFSWSSNEELTEEEYYKEIKVEDE